MFLKTLNLEENETRLFSLYNENHTHFNTRTKHMLCGQCEVEKYSSKEYPSDHL